jgi:hypothetical protein
MKKIYSLIALVSATLFITSCVQPTKEFTIHFKVDMNEMEDVYSAALIGGYNPLRWNKITPMQDLDSNGIYDTTITFDIPYKFLEFKFVANGKTIELEGEENRRVYFEEEDTITYIAKFNQVNNP